MNKGCLITLGLVLLVVTGLLAAYFVQKSDEAVAGIEITKPEIGDIVKKTVATGSIKPRQEVMVKPQVSGVVDQLYVEPGEMVKKGQRLARIKLIPSQVNINNAQSSVQLARIRFQDAERELDRQKEIFSKKLDVENARISFE
ncbi:MAG: biotin/lipoyl-binding protein, partial [Bacteroidota bacterium]